MKKALSLVLAVVLLCSCLPVTTFAQEYLIEESPAEVTEPVAASEPTEEPTEPVAETAEPVEEATVSVEETTASAEEPSAPMEEPTEPVEESTEPVEEFSAPTEESTESAEEPSAPEEESTESVEEPTTPAAVPIEPATKTAEAVRAGNSCGNNTFWTLTGNVLTLSGTGAMTNYSSYSRVPWYSYRSKIKIVVIEEGITSISNYAFYECSNLISINIPESVTTIGDRAFYQCNSLINILIPDSVTSMGEWTFYGCNGLTSVTIGEGVTSIGEYTFMFCDSLTNLTMCEGITSIGYRAFAGCSSLTSVIVPDSVIRIDSGAFEGCSGLTCLIIPDRVISIGNYAFYQCNSLTSVIIGNAVTSIGYEAFKDCSSLTSVIIGNAVTSIGYEAFYNCSSLTSITIGNGVTSIGNDAFFRCNNITELYITDVAAWLNISFGIYWSNPLFGGHGKKLYLNGKLVTDLVIPEGVISIGEDAFTNCSSLTSVTIPDSVISIGDGAFSHCSSLTSVTIPDSVTTIGLSAFYDCSSLTSVTIPDSVTTIGNWTFYNCSSLTSIIIPNSVTSIGKDVFYRCSSLTSITIPDSVISIGDGAFYKCDKIQDIYYGGTASEWAKLSNRPSAKYIHYDCKFLPPQIQNDAVSGKPVITWDAISEADNYEVYRSTSRTKNYKCINSTEDVCYMDESASAGKTYYYKVKAVYTSNGFLSSNLSAYKSAKCLYPQPEITEVTTNSSGYPQVKWGKIKGAKKYQVYYATSEDGEYKRLTTTSSTSYTYKDAKRDTEYFFKVRAYGSSSSYASAFSEVVSGFRTLARPSISLSTSQSNRKITVKWKSVSKAIGYELQCSINGGEFVTIAEGNILKFVHTDLAPGNEYTYRLRALSGKEETTSRYSSEKSSTIKVGKPTLTITLAENGKPQLTWEAVDGAVEYQIYYATSKKGSYKRVETTEELTFIYEAAKKGKTCYFKVRAVDINGAKGDYSSYVKIKSK